MTNNTDTPDSYSHALLDEMAGALEHYKDIDIAEGIDITKDCPAEQVLAKYKEWKDGEKPR